MSDKAKFTILSMMKDEGHCLIEWVAYHHHIGFDNICVYTNNCSDGTDDMLIRLEEMGYCRHFRNDVPEGKKPQPNALALATENPAVTNSEWILTMDADEFLSIKTGRGWVQNLVDAVPQDIDAIAITWRFFGSNGITDWNPGLVTESYKMAAPDQFKKGWGVKTLFKPYEHMKFGIHRPHIKKARQDPEMAKRLLVQKWVNGSGQMMPEEFSLSGWRSTKPTLGYKLAEMNHYGVKSYEAYLLRRIRGNVNNKVGKYDANYFALFDRNEVEAPNATRHTKAVKKHMARMLDDPKLRALYDGAMDHHRNRVEQLHKTGEYDQWLSELKEAAQTPIDKLDEILFTKHLPKAWQEKVDEMLAAGVPRKDIALMIARSQTARKAETREALKAAAEGREVDQTKMTSAQAAAQAGLETALEKESAKLLAARSDVVDAPQAAPEAQEASTTAPPEVKSEVQAEAQAKKSQPQPEPAPKRRKPTLGEILRAVEARRAAEGRSAPQTILVKHQLQAARSGKDTQ